LYYVIMSSVCIHVYLHLSPYTTLFRSSTWFRRYRSNPPRFTVTLDDGSVIDDAVFAICLNTNPYTYLGNAPLDFSDEATLDQPLDRKSTRLNSSHVKISYAVFCLKKKI